MPDEEETTEQTTDESENTTYTHTLNMGEVRVGTATSFDYLWNSSTVNGEFSYINSGAPSWITTTQGGYKESHLFNYSWGIRGTLNPSREGSFSFTITMGVVGTMGSDTFKLTLTGTAKADPGPDPPEPSYYTVYVESGKGGAVDRSSIPNVLEGSRISTNGNRMTVKGVTVTATPSTGFIFSSWSNVAGAITSDRTVTALFTEQRYNVTFVAGPGGTVAPDHIMDVPSGSIISKNNNEVSINGATAVATPNDGYAFSSWTNAEGRITADRTITANFVPGYKITIKPLSCAGCTATISATGYETQTADTTKEATLSVPQGTSVTLEAKDGGGFTFQNWTQMTPSPVIISNQKRYTFTIGSDMVVMANFGGNAHLFSLSVDAEGGVVKLYINDEYIKDVSYGVTYEASLGAGAKIRMEATPSTGIQFTGWSDEHTDNPYNITMGSEPLSLVAYFRTEITLGLRNTGGSAYIYDEDGHKSDVVSTIGAPVSLLVKAWTNVYLRASVNGGYVFDQWYRSQAPVSSANPYQFVPTAPMNFLASFKAGVTHNVIMHRPEHGSVYFNGELVSFSSETVSFTVADGRDATIKAVADTNFAFDKWLFRAGQIISIQKIEYTWNVRGDADIFAVFKADSDDPDERGEEDIPSGIPEVIDRCYLAFYADKEATSPTALLNLPNIQSVEENDTATLTELSTVIYGFEDNFCMDSGTIQKYTITLTRIQPEVIDDSSRNFSNQAKWSNGHWFNMLKFFIERWQNLNYGVFNEKNVRTGGFRFHFEPGSEVYRPDVDYNDLFPVLDKYVFVLGNVSMNMAESNLQYISVSIPLTVGSMVRLIQESTGGHKVTYLMKSGSSVKTVMTYPVGMDFPAANVPLNWYTDYPTIIGLDAFDYWLANSAHYNPMTIVPHTIDLLTGVWRSPSLIFDIDYDMAATDMLEKVSENEYRLSDAGKQRISGATMMRVWVISGGGGGAMGRWWSPSGTTPYRRGGGGGSGGFGSSSAKMPNSYSSIRFVVGEGGEYGMPLHDAGDGGYSLVSFLFDDGEQEIIRIEGGIGGSIYGHGGRGSSSGGADGGDAYGDSGGDGAAIPALKPENHYKIGNYSVVSVGGKGTVHSGDDAPEYVDGVKNRGAGGGGGGADVGFDHMINNGGDGAPGYLVIAFYM